jgi:sulfite reductase (ferredoxin)
LTETKAQRVERWKREKNPWDALEEIRAFARNGRSSVPPEWTGLYFRWWGIYTQGDGVGALGGKGGEGKATDYFMLRTAIPNGRVTSRQLRALASLSKKWGRNVADITTRQSIQLHWIPVEGLPDVIDTITSVGLSSRGACGDVVRNVTGCPLAGVQENEILDASPVALGVYRMLSGNAEFYNLPRKFKICVTGCPVWCTYPEINDVALTAVRRGSELGFSLRVGGGLSSEPHLAVRLNAFVPVPRVLEIVRAVTEIFRDQQCLREHRERARLKYLFLREGWTPERFLDEVHARLPFRLDPAPEEAIPEGTIRDHVGVHRQKQQDFYYVGASVLRGRLTGDQLEAAANLADRFGNGELRTTTMQNLLFLNVPRQNVDALIKGVNDIQLRVDGSPFWRGAITCTGTEFCKLAITETKEFARWLVEEMEVRLPGFDQLLKLHVTGCPNSCGQHWIADVGLDGKKIKHNGALVDAYSFSLGGGVGEKASIARPIAYRCPAEEVPEALERLLRFYLREREGREDLQSFFRRHTNDELRALLAGEAVTQIEREPVGVGD